MLRAAAFVSLILLAAATTASAQCVTPSGTVVTLTATTTWPPDDEGLSAPLPLGFAFPLGVSTWTHVVIDSNGALYLTNGGPAIGPTGFGFADMSGQPGDSPRIGVTWADLEGIAAGYAVLIDTSVANQCKVVWQNVTEYGTPGAVPFTSQVVLHDSGLVEISPGAQANFQFYTATVGISEANAVAATPSDLSSGPTGTGLFLYEDFPSPSTPDVANTTVTLLPVSGPTYLALTTCTGPPVASHTPYGTGCYREYTSVYEYFDFGAIDLTGSGMSMLLTSGYSVLPALTAYQPPSTNATVLVLQDDDETTVNLSAPFTYPGGTTMSLTVCSNGYVSTSSNGVNVFPDTYLFLDSPNAAWHSWHDFDPTSGGAVKFEEIGGIAYLTWDGVHTYGTTTPETMQMQFDLTSGAVHFHWVSLSGAGGPYLVGYSPGGPSLDPGSIDLSTSLPVTTGGADLVPLTLSASPPATSTPTTGSIVTYTIDNALPDGSGNFVGVLVLSNGQILPPGVDLSTLLGAPGCAQYITTLDVLIAVYGTGPSMSATFPIPPGIPSFTFYGQAVALFVPNSLPNGQNPGGFLATNGIVSLLSVH